MIWCAAQTFKMAGELTIMVCEISARYQFRGEWTCAWRTMESRKTATIYKISRENMTLVEQNYKKQHYKNIELSTF